MTMQGERQVVGLGSGKAVAGVPSKGMAMGIGNGAGTIVVGVGTCIDNGANTVKSMISIVKLVAVAIGGQIYRVVGGTIGVGE